MDGVLGRAVVRDSPSPVRSTLYCMPLASVMTPSLFLFSARNFSPTALEPRARAHEHRRSAARSIWRGSANLDHVTGVEEPERPRVESIFLVEMYKCVVSVHQSNRQHGPCVCIYHLDAILCA